MIEFEVCGSSKKTPVAASLTVSDEGLLRWRLGFEDMFALVAGQFAQVESRRRAKMYLLGLLSGAERKNSWTIAEQAGNVSPDGICPSRLTWMTIRHPHDQTTQTCGSAGITTQQSTPETPPHSKTPTRNNRTADGDR